MPRERNAEYKPLLFTTTLRNPDRIAAFLGALLPFENKILDNDIVIQVAKKLISEKLYTPTYVNKTPKLKSILQNDNKTYSDIELKTILEKSPQNHKEAGFDKGWASRFDTWYKFPMELGFVFYEIGKPLIVSNTGHMLVDAYNEETPNGDKIQNVFLNAMMKYQTCNPFRKILNENAPLVLLLKVIELLKADEIENGAGIAKREIPFIICSPNNDATEIYNEIKALRKANGFEYSDEQVYEICLAKIGATDEDRKRFKMYRIVKEGVDDFIRKMRITGTISLRGMGRFVDFNMFEIDKINYVLANYFNYKKFASKTEYFDYIGKIDSNILTPPKVSMHDIAKIRKTALAKWAAYYSNAAIICELEKLASNKPSTDEILKEINKPTRLEFLTSIALKQNFDNLDVSPNYKIDDEGLPTFTAAGGVADIECFDSDCNSLFEVTLLCARNQATNELPAITRHLIEKIAKSPKKQVYSVLIAPSIHPDSIYMSEFSKDRYKVDILTLTIIEFMAKIQANSRVVELLNH